MIITYQETKDVPIDSLCRLFHDEQWNDFYDPDEVALYQQAAVHIITAWDGDRLVGYARLSGTGRLEVEITDVLVESDYQGQGIGTELVGRLVDRIKDIDPYFIQVSPIGDREVHLYEKFGFTEMPNYRRMELMTGRLTEKVKRVRGEV
ncbi:MAG: GNAT family N-acetyltransferase [Armatimonadota bacterium]